MSLFKRNESDPKKMFYIVVIAFVVVEALSFLASKLGLMDFIKGGFILVLMGIVILLSVLFTFGINIMQVKAKEIILMILVLAILVLLYIFLPTIVPQIFSTVGIDQTSSNSLREFFRVNIGSVLNIGTGTV